jgi:ATP-dependent Clp protease ATP-binding subunit ClpC
MFERFTDRARNVVVLAQEEARLLKHNYIGTEHILLGLARESDGLAAKALEALGISLEAAREQVVEIIGRGERSPSGHIPFTPRAKKVLELSLREALQFGHNYIGTEHLLLGLIREGEGVAAQVLVRLGGDLSAIRQQVIRLLKEKPTTEELPRAAQAAQAQAARLAESAAEAGIIGRAEGAVPAGIASPAESASLSGKLTEVLSRLDAISNRLTMIERAVGIGNAMDDD